MTLDEAGRRSFVGARSPAVLLVYDTDSGRSSRRRRSAATPTTSSTMPSESACYVICGEGRVDVFRQTTPTIIL